MNYENILKATQCFYDLAKKDVMIGYHFRFIENFDEHIPRIANFWYLQLNNKAYDKSHLPFKLLEVHKTLGIKKGEVGRWVTLFEQNLSKMAQDKIITNDEQDIWLKSVGHFQEKLMQFLFKTI